MSVAWGKRKCTTARFAAALFAVMFVTLAQAQLPDAPLPRVAVSNRAHDVDVSTILEQNTWKHTLNWQFAAVHGVYFGALLFDQHETLKGEAEGCALEQGDNGPYYATRGDLMKKNMPFFAGITAADMLLRKVGVPIAWMVGPGVATVKHVQGGMRWVHLCGR